VFIDEQVDRARLELKHPGVRRPLALEIRARFVEVSAQIPPTCSQTLRVTGLTSLRLFDPDRASSLARISAGKLNVAAR
jgi:hypothetical protein